MGIFESIKCRIKDRGRPLLSDRTIIEYNKKNLLVEGDLIKEQIQPNSIDLTLASSVKTLKRNFLWTHDGLFTDIIDPRKPIEYHEDTFKVMRSVGDDRPCYVLEPNQFVLMASREVLNIPNGIIAFVQGRSSIARLSIQTEQAGLIDAGFRGTITFEVINQSKYPIFLFEGIRVAQVYFFKAQYASYAYGTDGMHSKYYNQILATGSQINQDHEWQRKE